MADDDYEEEEIPKEEKLGILQYFIANSPPGHQNTVLQAAKKLNLADAIDDDVLKKIFREFNVSTHVVLPRESGGNYVVSSEGELQSGKEYRSVKHGEVFSVDHVKGKVLSAKADGESVSKEAKAILKAMDEYVASNYHKEGSAIEVYDDGNDKIHIVMGIEHKKLKVFWSGRWQSKYTIKYGGGSAKVTGDVRMLLHYFEGGNVQQSLEKDFKEFAVSYSDESSLAKALVTEISKKESELQGAVSALYQTMEVLAKGMRRLLPMNKIHFDWVNYAKYQVRDQYSNMTVAGDEK